MEVYALIDPRDGKAYYVGMSRDADARYRAHLKNVPGHSNSRKVAWIRELKAAGLKPKLKLLETDVEDDMAFEREDYWIRLFHDKRQPLLNDLQKKFPGKGGAAKGNKYASKDRAGRHISVWLTGGDIAIIEALLAREGVTPERSEVDSVARLVLRDNLPNLLEQA